MTMVWEQLLCSERLRQQPAKTPAGRSPFQTDIDRICFSTPFRRLANKTQVHPLADDDHIHNRLTHSIEVSSVGRSLGTAVGEYIKSRHPDISLTRDEFGYIIQAACLAHDIGNPPYGHAGETAIGNWFKAFFKTHPGLADQLSETQKSDLCRFEGNAQGFRILTCLEMYKQDGGMRLTNAVLATFSKYTCESTVDYAEMGHYMGARKFGFYNAELHLFREVAEKTGLTPLTTNKAAWMRHPFAYLVEAADDICYRIIDLEDGFNMGALSLAEVKHVLSQITEVKQKDKQSDMEYVAYLRAIAINKCVQEAVSVFIEHEAEILEGGFKDTLLSHCRYAQAFRDAGQLCREKLFKIESKVTRELGGYAVINGLLDKIVPAAVAITAPENLSYHDEQICTLIGPDFIERNQDNNVYEILLQVTDFIAGMTDRYAFNLHKKLNGTDI